MNASLNFNPRTHHNRKAVAFSIRCATRYSAAAIPALQSRQSAVADPVIDQWACRPASSARVNLISRRAARPSKRPNRREAGPAARFSGQQRQQQRA
jgi:hypothetical protein